MCKIFVPILYTESTIIIISRDYYTTGLSNSFCAEKFAIISKFQTGAFISPKLNLHVMLSIDHHVACYIIRVVHISPSYCILSIIVMQRIELYAGIFDSVFL